MYKEFQQVTIVFLHPVFDVPPPAGDTDWPAETIQITAHTAPELAKVQPVGQCMDSVWRLGTRRGSGADIGDYCPVVGCHYEFIGRYLRLCPPRNGCRCASP